MKVVLGNVWKGRSSALAAIMLLASAGHALATPVMLTLDPTWADYHSYAYTDVDGIARTATIGAYMATFSGTGFSGTPTAYVFCNDFNVDTNIGTAYSGYLILPSTQLELEEAYLMNKVAASDPSGHGYNADIQSMSGPVSMAIWLLQNPSSTNPAAFPVDATSAALITEAQNAVLHGAFTAGMASNYYIWMPDTLGTSQRFGVMYVSQSVPGSLITTPEPSTMLMFGAGAFLIFLGKVKRNRRKK